MNKLTYRNNWASDEYFVDGKRISDLTEIEYLGQWYRVKSRRVSVPYSDMGNIHTATSTHFFIEHTILGVTQELDLNRIVPKNKSITAIEFVLAED